MSSKEILSVEKFYSEAKTTGKVLGLICEKDHVTVPPRLACRICNSKKLTVKELSGYGSIISYTSVHTKSAAFPLDVPYDFALVRLDEGGNLLGIVEWNSSGKGLSRVKIKFRSVPEGDQRPRIFFEVV